MILTRDQLDASAQMDPQVAEALSKFPPQQATNHDDPTASRNGVQMLERAMSARIGPTPANVEEFYHQIALRDGFMSSLKIHKPATRAPGALVVLCFGGGFVCGSNEQFNDTARALVQLTGATVVSISYRLAPEHKFPQAQLDALDSLEWLAANATGDLLAADPAAHGFVLGGISAGGNIAACLSRHYQTEKTLAHPLTGQWLAVPTTMDHDVCPDKFKHLHISREQNAWTPSLDKDALAGLERMVQWDMASPLRVPLRSSAPIAGQPKTYFQVCGMDPLRDDALIYDEMLREAGVQTKLDFYPGCPHAHWFMTLGYEVGNKAAVDSVVGIGWLLGVTVDRGDAAKALALPNC